ncbi:hypothetical protein PMAYCL1PPCAC_05748, partial [Pristionchus mayeri]
FRAHLMIGRVVAILGCLLYLFAEVMHLPLSKYVVLVVFLMHATAEGSIIIVRSYVPRISLPEDRAAAYGIKNGAVLLSIILGPLILLLFSPIPWPEGGIVIIDPWLKFNFYTSVIWLILLFNILALYIVIFHIREPFDMEGERMDHPAPLLPSLRKAWSYVKTLDKMLIIMCIVEKGLSGGGFQALLTFYEIKVRKHEKHTEIDQMTILAVASTGVGLCSIAVALLFVFAKLGTIVPASRTFPISLILLLVMFLLSYPFPLISDAVPVKNGE